MSSRTSRPRLSVILQAYNTRPFIVEALESILTQEGDFDLDVLVIDDASTDGTAAAIAGIEDPRVRTVVHPQNAGAIATANEGYAAATGDFVLRLDSDDRVRPGYFAAALAALDIAPRAGFAYGDIVTIDPEGRVTSGRLLRRQARPLVGDEFLPLLLENFVPAPTCIVRRAALAPLLPVPAHFRFLDWYVTTGIAETWETAFVDMVGADYRIHGDNMHRAMIRDRRGEETSKAILDRLFASDVRGVEKRRWGAQVYARHYVVYADKYFGSGMFADARRCYLRALARRPGLLLDSGLSRHLAGAIVGRRAYAAAKSAVSAGFTP